MKILVAGIIARYPFGGVTWCSLMPCWDCALGHEVLYIEDTGECIYDPEQNTRSEILPTARYINDALEPFGLGDRWSFVNFNGEYHGVSREGVRAFCADADLFVNLSGGSWFWRDGTQNPAPRLHRFRSGVHAAGDCQGRRRTSTSSRASIISSPSAPTSVRRRAPRHPGGFTWHKTWQPVVTELWHSDAPPVRDRFTTVMTWKIESFTDVDGNKDKEFIKFIDLPRRTPHRFELAVNGPSAFASTAGTR